jgi:ceramide glucosyltransferase
VIHLLVEGLTIAAIVMAAAGCVYALGAALAVRHFAPERASAGTDLPTVTILKPLYGAEASLYENLASFCDQRYDAPVQWIFGVHAASDPAAAVVDRLRAERPDLDLEIIVTAATRGANPKVSNLVGMQRRIRHDVVIVADSDIAVAPDYGKIVVGALMQPGVGLVTCLYRGVGSGGVWGRLASMAIDYRFLPDVLVGLHLGMARPGFGSTLALRRSTLLAIGGFEAFLDQLADDNAIGVAVRGMGLRVAIPSCIVVHTCPEETATELLAHEVRWTRTVRVLSPGGYAGLVITHPLPFALLAAAAGAASDISTTGLTLVALAILCRLVLQIQIDRFLGVHSGRWWLGPARDMLSFAVYVAGCFASVVSWRGVRYRVRADGTLAPLERPKA